MKFVRRLIQDERGFEAIEFAIVGPPFILLMLAIVELGLTLLTQTLLDGATRDAARLIRTGQVQSGSTTSAQVATFQTLLCSDMSTLLTVATCDSGLMIEANTFATFGAVAFSSCNYNANSSGSGTACPFVPGTPKQIVAVQVSYARPSLIPWVAQYLTVGGTGFTTLVSTVVFRNEPY
jgi:Flp pilus assembly protein TadG